MIKITQGIPAGAEQLAEIAVTATVADLEFLSDTTLPPGGLAAGFEINLTLIDTLVTKLRGVPGQQLKAKAQALATALSNLSGP